MSKSIADVTVDWLCQLLARPDAMRDVMIERQSMPGRYGGFDYTVVSGDYRVVISARGHTSGGEYGSLTTGYTAEVYDGEDQCIVRASQNVKPAYDAVTELWLARVEPARERWRQHMQRTIPTRGVDSDGIS